MWPGRHLSLLDGHPSHPSSTGGASLDASQLRGLDALQVLQALLSAAGSSGLAGPSHPVSLLGAFSAGFLCCCLLFALFWYRVRATVERGTRRHRQRKAAEVVAKMEPQELRDVLGEVGLPAWAELPDNQRVQWLNQVFSQVWPFFARWVSQWAHDNVTDLLQQSKPPWIRSIKMHHFTLGGVLPEITGAKVYGEGRNDEVQLDLDFTWAGDQEMSFVVKPVPRSVPSLPVAGPLLDLVSNAVVIKAAIDHWAVQGRLRLRLRPLLAAPPVVGGVQVSLTHMPRFSFDLTVYGGELAVLPGLESWLHALIQDSVLRPWVLPERYEIPFVEGGAAGGDRPGGLLEVRVVEAKHVPRMDIITASDPYVKLFVRSTHQLQTQVQENTSHPHWDESFSMLVHFPDTQNLTLVMYDWDIFDKDDEIGRAEVAVRELEPGRPVDKWVEVRPAHQEKSASDKYFTSGNPASWVVGAGQKAMGVLTRPWDHRPFRLLRDDKRKSACQLHLQLHYTPFEPDDVDAALKARDAGGDSGEAAARLARLSPRVRNILMGGLLYVHIKKVESLVTKPWLLGGWKHSIKISVLQRHRVKAELGGTAKWTAAARSRKGSVAIDQELEFIVDGEEARKAESLRLEVWYVHWRDALAGRLAIPFQHIKQSQVVRETYDLRDVAKGRVQLELQWLPAFGAS